MRSVPIKEDVQVVVTAQYQYDDLLDDERPHVYSAMGVTVAGETKRDAEIRLSIEIRKLSNA